MKKDIGMLGKGKSDPYVVVTLGAQEFRSKTIDNTVNPKWDFWCEVKFHKNMSLFLSTLLYIKLYFTFVFELWDETTQRPVKRFS